MTEQTHNKINTNNLWLWAGIALVLAIIFDYLFFEKIFGISVIVYGVLVLGTLFWFSKSHGKSIKPAIWLVPFFLFFSVMPAVRANGTLMVLNMLAALGTFLLMTRAIVKDNIFKFTFFDYILTAVLWPAKYIGRGFRSLVDLIRGAKSRPAGQGRQVLIGILTALPVLFFFGILFISADLAFRRFVEQTLAFNFPAETLPQIFIIVFAFAACLGLFSYLLNPWADVKDDLAGLVQMSDMSGQNRKVEIGVFLSLIAALFLLFIAFQIHYLFGGVENISFAGFTYAEYARKGFWELLVVAFSTLLILLTVDNHSIRQIKQDVTAQFTRRAWLLVPALIIIGEVLVMMVSAFKRLALYQAAYGMSELRLYVFATVIFFAVIFVALAVKVYHQKTNAFMAFTVIVSLMAFFVGMNILNPDMYVAKHNINQFGGTDKLDGNYLATLSADAAPVLLNLSIDKNPDWVPYRNDYIENISPSKEKGDLSWQSWNWARNNARHMLPKQ